MEGRAMTDIHAAGPAAEPVRTFPERHYKLYLREGFSRFVWRLRDEGITLSDDTLRWTLDGRPRERNLDDLREVRLQFAHVHKSGDVGLCQMKFNNGMLLTVQSTDMSGLADHDRAPIYGDFVRDLHARLAVRTGSTIAFRAGDDPHGRVFTVIVVTIATLFFGALPLGLFLFKPGWETLGVLGAGAAFVWPVWRTMQRNEPRHYSPGHLPDDLFP
jgi:hypothetical protein